MVAQLYYADQAVIGVLSLGALILSCLQLRTSIRQKIKGDLKYFFHRAIPILPFCTTLASIDPHGIHNIWNRLILGLFRAEGACVVIACLAKFVSVTATSVYITQRRQPPRIMNIALIALAVIFAINENAVAIAKSLDANATSPDAVRYFMVAFMLWAMFAVLVFFSWKLNTELKLNTRRLSMAASSVDPKATQRALKRVWRIEMICCALAFVTSAIEIYLGVQALNGRDDPTPLNSEEAKKYEIRHSFSTIVQLAICYVGIWLVWIPMHLCTDAPAASSNSHSRNSRSVTLSKRNSSFRRSKLVHTNSGNTTKSSATSASNSMIKHLHSKSRSASALDVSNNDAGLGSQEQLLHVSPEEQSPTPLPVVDDEPPSPEDESAMDHVTSAVQSAFSDADDERTEQTVDDYV